MGKFIRNPIFLGILTVGIRLSLSASIGMKHASLDMHSWQKVIEVLSRGDNPYKELTVLNWAPCWMVVLFLISSVTNVFNFSLTSGIQIFLAVVDGIIVIQLLRLAKLIGIKRKKFLPILLLVYVFNPVPILLSVQHLNFDALFLLFCLLCIEQLIYYSREMDSGHWLIAAAFAGVAFFVKTPAIFIAAALLAGAGQRKLTTNLMGAWIFAFPWLISMSVLYALSPEEVYTNVIRYHSLVVFPFGLSPFTTLFGLRGLHTILFLFGFVGLLWFLFRPTFKNKIGESGFFLTSTAILILYCIELGPGFGTQYLLWIWIYLPLFLTLSSPVSPALIWGIIITADIGYIGLYLFQYELGASASLISPPFAKLELVQTVFQRPFEVVSLTILFILLGLLLVRLFMYHQAHENIQVQ